MLRRAPSVFLGASSREKLVLGADPAKTISCIEKLASAGASWQPDRYHYTQFRKALGETDAFQAVDLLNRLLKADVFGKGVFPEMMSTPKMRELLKLELPGIDFLRKAAKGTQGAPATSGIKAVVTIL